MSDTDNGEEGGVPGGLSPKSRVDVGEEDGIGIPGGLLQQYCVEVSSSQAAPPASDTGNEEEGEVPGGPSPTS